MSVFLVFIVFIYISYSFDIKVCVIEKIETVHVNNGLTLIVRPEQFYIIWSLTISVPILKLFLNNTEMMNFAAAFAVL